MIVHISINLLHKEELPMIVGIIVCSVIAVIECWCCLRAAGKSDYFDELEFEEKERKGLD
jgi:hypothetical protein